MRPFVEFQNTTVNYRYNSTFRGLTGTQDDLAQEKLKEPKKSCLIKGDRVQRSKSIDGRSSLKLDLTSPELIKYRSVPSSPSPKKVHFADSEGLALVNVKNFIPSSDELSALETVSKLCRDRPKLLNNHIQKAGVHSLVPCFEAKRMEEVLLKLRLQNICLECVQIQARTVTLIVRVKNVDFEKIVSLRYTLDDWQSFEEVFGNYIPKSGDGLSDRFMMVLTVPRKSKSVEFALRYRVKGQEYWDNNDGQNYKLSDILSF